MRSTRSGAPGRRRSRPSSTRTKTSCPSSASQQHSRTARWSADSRPSTTRSSGTESANTTERWSRGCRRCPAPRRWIGSPRPQTLRRRSSRACSATIGSATPRERPCLASPTKEAPQTTMARRSGTTRRSIFISWRTRSRANQRGRAGRLSEHCPSTQGLEMPNGKGLSLLAVHHTFRLRRCPRAEGRSPRRPTKVVFLRPPPRV
mmetsp:Transcript_70836/g.196113  ORF Transcript_70836/g.196113 Transcript_70836/m.196113 type:complete len:205 (+) Transcript_70836:320-934(+)